MKKYFYIIGNEQFGPFTFEELALEDISRETNIWFDGLNDWTEMSEINELKGITKSIPPTLDKRISGIESSRSNQIDTIETRVKNKDTSSRNIKIVLLSLVGVIIILFVYSMVGKKSDREFYSEISESSYDADVDFYVDKFYRDISHYGLYPKKPKKTIIKFAKLDQIDNATHIHGISYGIYNDDLIEIYINPSTWETFDKPLRYYLIYHELAHDILNIDDLDHLPIHEGKLMFPAIESYNSISMDEFIEMSHALFEEVSRK
jgi:hypothetical protein